jgi:hypothetical protein
MIRMRLARFVSAVTLVSLVACGPSKRNNGDDDDADAAQPDSYCPTSISGKVFAPNGTLPLYNVTVYAPVSDPPPFTSGVQCGQCTTSLPGGAYASVSTDPEGKFKLEGVPIGFNIPIIINTGKWRRKFVIPEVAACTETVIPDGQFRLPKNRTEGDIPRVAIVTGGFDALACILPKLGVDASEFGSSSSSDSRFVFYDGQGGTSPGTAQPSTALHGNLLEMKKFDLIINTCEGNEYNDNKTSPDLLRQYADIGGRVLGSHFHYTWSKNLIPQWRDTATWDPAVTGGTNGPNIVDQTHPGGQILAKWMMSVGASTQLGIVDFGSAQLNNQVSAVAPSTTRWIKATGVIGSASETHYLSFNTPVGLMPENQCGKVVYAGPHVSGSSGSLVGEDFPQNCPTTFTAAEKAFAFLIFDLTTCVNPLE